MVSAHYRFLWIRGKPGAGKSTLMKFISTNISNRGQTVVSFFFNARGESLEKSTEGCYRSLLYQLLEKVPGLAVPRTPHLLKASTGSITWHISILQDALLRVVSQLGQAEVMLFVDALDECNRSEVYNMVKYFEQLGKTAMERNIKLFTCFSSRHYPSIPIKTNLTFVVEDQMGHNNDLEYYIMDNLDVGDGESAHAVRWALLNKAAGVFMWAVLVIRMLNQGYLEGRIRELKHRVDSLPNKLSDLFKNIMENDKENEAEFALSIQWILYAKRPLRIEEYYYAMAAGLYLRKAELGEWDENEVTKADMRRYVSSSSKGLAETIASGSLVRVQFIHESVREFFTTKNGGVYDIWPERTDWGETQSHDRLKECCYAYLQARSSDLVKQFNKCDLLQDDLWWEVWEEKVEAFPFINYAVAQVLFHAEMAASDFPQRDFLKSFDLRSWITLYNRLNRYYRDIFTLSANMFYVLASQNYPRLISAAADYDPMLHVYGEAYGCPLFAALRNGPDSRHTVETILRLGGYRSDANNLLPQGWESRPVGEDTPLTFATQWGYREFMKILLDKGADPNTAGPGGRRPLEIAIQRKRQWAIQLLLERGANANGGERYLVPTLRIELYRVAEFIAGSEDPDAGEFLRLASGGRLLLNTTQRMSDENARVGPGYAVEQLALEIEKKFRHYKLYGVGSLKDGPSMPNIVQLLLGQGAQIDSRDARGMTPLHYAAAVGEMRTTKLLLQRGAQVDSQDLRGMSPLHHAAVAGKTGAAKFLLRMGARVDSQDLRGMSPLHHAAAAGEISAAESLLRRGAQVDSQDLRGMSPLHHAAAAEEIGVAELLLRNGAQVNLRDARGMSPLHCAAKAGRVSSAFLLLRNNAQTMLRDKKGRTPLSYATSYGHSDIARRLLPPGARMHLRGRGLITRLKYAARYIGDRYKFERIVETFRLNAPNHWTFRTGREFRIESRRPWRHRRRQGRSCWKKHIGGQMPPPSTVLTLPDPKLLSWLR
ncbi:putative NACHT and Ankyrin domain protein [Rosellinia necatrix]|uniref:Putative NACHT and Ankyrin domain protein n=1 Tax=Rosellinia necatrix TaxID=77044 RepID=A0A1S8AB76_ROSNE|nr:putative NACHT and Ankyrin domain protein [Rosellinia necatrix]